MLPTAMLALALLTSGAADDSTTGRTEMDKGRQAYAQQQYTDALTRFDAAEQIARTEGDGALLVECLRLRAAVQRDSGDAVHAEQPLQQAAGEAAKAYGDSSPELAAVLEEIATGNRAQGRAEPALAAIDKAIKIREAQTDAARAGLARDLTLAGVLPKKGVWGAPHIELHNRPTQEWSRAHPGN